MRRFHRDDRAQSLVEFALILPLLLMLTVGVFDAARAVWTSSILNAAVREGTRYAIVHGASSSQPSGPGGSSFIAPDRDTAVEAVVRRHASNVPALSVNAAWPDGDNQRGSRVVVRAAAPFVPVLSSALLGGGLSVTLTAGSQLVIH